jgi:large subunit ribosomal protein L29
VPSVAELEELDDEELATRLAECRRELLNLRFQLATSQLDNSARILAARRDVARVLTLIREREIALAEGREVSREVAVSVRAAKRRAAATAELEEAELSTSAQGLESDSRELDTETEDEEVSDELDTETEDEEVSDELDTETEDEEVSDEPEDEDEEVFVSGQGRTEGSLPPKSAPDEEQEEDD